MADFILANQDGNGAIPSAPGSHRVNEDSDMEYALMGLAAAYAEYGDRRYLRGLGLGLTWLADRQDLAGRWRGSWRYAYSATPPYRPVRVSPGAGIDDVRGVDSTSALFVHLVDSYRRLGGSRRVVRALRPHAQAALDFLMRRSRSGAGWFLSSYHLRDGRWRQWRYAYAADQGDVLLGMQAGRRLTGDRRYGRVAGWLIRHIRTGMFLPGAGRFALGRDVPGPADTGLEGFNGIFPQGYLAMLLGDLRRTRAADAWLRHRVGADGALRVRPGAPTYALSTAMLGLSSAATGRSWPRRSRRWLLRVAFDPRTGGVRDLGSRGPLYVNVAGLSLISLLQHH